MTACRSASEVVEASDVVVIAVKPYQVADVVAPIREALAGKVVVSVAAGMPFSAYEGILAPGTHHMSCVPNTPVSVGKGVFVCEATDSLTSEERALVDEIFSHVGIVERIDTAHMGVAGTVAGCGPAWVCMLIEALGDAGVKHGPHPHPGLPPRRPDGCGHRRDACRKRRAPRGAQGRRLLARRHHHQGRGRTGARGSACRLIDAVDAVEGN